MQPVDAPPDPVRPGDAQTGEVPCRTCGGSGRVEGEPCPTCGGSGVQFEIVGDA